MISNTDIEQLLDKNVDLETLGSVILSLNASSSRKSKNPQRYNSLILRLFTAVSQIFSWNDIQKTVLRFTRKNAALFPLFSVNIHRLIFPLPAVFWNFAAGNTLLQKTISARFFLV